MANLFAKYETDKAAETTGIPVVIDGCTFICKRAGGHNRLYPFAISAAMSQLREELESKDPDVLADAEAEVTLRAYADAVVVGWENVEDRNGNPWPFSKENFLELMRACPDVWTRIRMEAKSIDGYRLKEVEEVAEEVGKSSSGTSSGEST